jgi:hypothetical protein
MLALGRGNALRSHHVDVPKAAWNCCRYVRLRSFRGHSPLVMSGKAPGNSRSTARLLDSGQRLTISADGKSYVLPPINVPRWRGRLVSSAFRLSTAAVSSRSRARASLRNRHLGRSIMGSEDEAEQSLWRPYRRQVQADMRTHLIPRPARDISPPRGGARASSYRS